MKRKYTNISDIVGLPRYSPKLLHWSRAACVEVETLKDCRIDNDDEAIDWIIQNTTGRWWCIEPGYYVFSKKSDASLFKLRWVI